MILAIALLCTVGLVPAALFDSPAGAVDSLEPVSSPPARLNLEQLALYQGIKEYYVVDVTGDDLPEIVLVDIGHHAYLPRLFSRDRVVATAVDDCRFAQWLSTAVPLDIDSLPGYEIARCLKDIEGDSTWIEVATHSDSKKENNVLCRTEAVHGADNSPKSSFIPGAWDGHVDECYAADLDGDGTRELIVGQLADYDCYPRGVFCYDYPSGRLRWKYLTPGPPQDIRLADADGDGRLEVFFKSWNPGNGCQADEAGDNTAFVYALNHQGRLLWRKTLDDGFDLSGSNFLLCDCDADGAQEVYYTTMTRVDRLDTQIRTLEKHDALTNKHIRQRSFDPDEQYGRLHTGDLDGDGALEIVTDNFPTALSSLTLESIREGSLRQWQLKAVTDVDSDKRSLPEVLVARFDSLKVLSPELTEIAAYGFGQGKRIDYVSAFDDPYGRRLLGVLVRTSSSEMNLHILQTNDVPAGSPFTLSGEGRFSWPAAILLFATGLLVGGGVVVALRSGRRSSHRSAPDEYELLLSQTTTFRHGQLAARNLDRLGLLFGNLPESDERFRELRPNLNAAVDAYRSFTSPQLKKLMGLAIRLRELRTLAEKVQNEMRVIDGHLTSSIPTELPENLKQRLQKDIPEASIRIKDILSDLHRSLKARFTADLTSTLRGILTACSPQMRQEGIMLGEITVSGDFSRSVFFSESGLAAILEELIANARRAMADAPRKVLSITVAYSDTRAVLRIIDSGLGIAADDPEALFSREYSTKQEGGGFGLFHARREIEKFGGRISISNNGDAVGATIEIQLRTNDGEPETTSITSGR